MCAGKVPDAVSVMEYADLLTTLELAAAAARLDGRKVNEAIRNCCTACMSRVRCQENYRVLKNLRAVAFPRTPEGAVVMMRNRMDLYMIKEPENGES